MEEIKSKTESLAHEVLKYCDTSMELGMINAAQKTSTFAAKGLTAILLLALSLLILFFCSLGLALWIGEVLNNVKVGYFIISFAYILIAIATFAFRKKLLYPFVRNSIIKQIYDNDNDV